MEFSLDLIFLVPLWSFVFMMLAVVLPVGMFTMDGEPRVVCAAAFVMLFVGVMIILPLIHPGFWPAIGRGVIFVLTVLMWFAVIALGMAAAGMLVAITPRYWRRVLPSPAARRRAQEARAARRADRAAVREAEAAARASVRSEKTAQRARSDELDVVFEQRATQPDDAEQNGEGGYRDRPGRSAPFKSVPQTEGFYPLTSGLERRTR